MPPGLNLFAILSAILFLCLTYSIYLNIRLGMTILKFEDTVEESLDVIDERYRSISKILEIPIFFDSVEVRQVVSDIRVTRESLLLIANNLSKAAGDPGESQIEDKKVEVG